MSEQAKRLRDILVKASEGRRVVITGHDHADVDSVIACLLMRDLLAAWNVPAEIALPLGVDRQSRRVLSWFDLDADALTGEILPTDALVLLDHHAASRQGEVVAVIDHHPTDMPPDCPYVQIEPRGACAMQVMDLMMESGVQLSRRQEEMAVTALWLDTVALRSAKISAQEAAWGSMRAEQLELDRERLEREGLGLRDIRLPAQELAMQQKKTFDFSGVRVCSTSIQAHGMTKEKLEEILSVLRAAVREEKAALWVYLLGDPLAGRSTEYDVYPDGMIKTVAYEMLASRGKDVMPRVEREMLGRLAEKQQ